MNVTSNSGWSKNCFVCKSCGEIDDKKTKTGATIDSKYYCQSCYWEKWEKNETENI